VRRAETVFFLFVSTAASFPGSIPSIKNRKLIELLIPEYFHARIAGQSPVPWIRAILRMDEAPSE